MIAGVDEAGRGPLAGPVVAAAVVLCRGGVPGVADSKALSPARRSELEAAIRRRCRFGLGWASVEEIDRLNIYHATHLAMARAVDALVAASGREPARVLVDGNRLPGWRWPSRAVVGGDATVPAISAASILAKEARDRMMVSLDARHAGYGFARHKGYGTAEHRAALDRLGPCEHHRRSFAPVARRLGESATAGAIAQHATR